MPWEETETSNEEAGVPWEETKTSNEEAHVHDGEEAIPTSRGHGGSRHPE